MKLYKEQPVLTSQFDVSKLQKQLQSVMQIHLDQSANQIFANTLFEISYNARNI